MIPRRSRRAVLAAALALSVGHAAARGPGALFRDVSTEAGVTFRHHAAPDKKYIVESMSGGAAVLDYDNDGRLDIYLVDSLTVDTAGDRRAARSALYRNLGNGRFEDVTDRAGVGFPGWGMGVCVADVDADGWADLYVTALGGNTLFRNNHDGTFSDVTAAAGVGGAGWSTGCGFADYDRDGRLDLFVSRYVSIDLHHLPEFGRDKTCQYRGIAVQCGPRGLPGEGDLLFHHEEGLRFREVGAQAGVSDPNGYFGLGVAWFDANADGWPDLYVANDSTPNFLYLNQHDGTFKEAGFPMGVAVSDDGAEQGSMGVAVGDYDGSGRFSLFVTNFSEEYNALYRNVGPHFSDVSFRANVAAVSLPYVGWGDAFFDYDNDGWPDLLAVNGHVYPQLDQARLGASAGYRQRMLLFHNRGDGRFDEVGHEAGPALSEPRVARGIAVGDLDGDGGLDVVVNDLDGAAQVLHNATAARGHWIVVAPEGRQDRFAIGAIVTVQAGGRRQQRLVQSGTGYLSQDDMRAHFGLGVAERADRIEVRWPDGTMTHIDDVPADRVIAVRQEPPATSAR